MARRAESWPRASTPARAWGVPRRLNCSSMAACTHCTVEERVGFRPCQGRSQLRVHQTARVAPLAAGLRAEADRALRSPTDCRVRGLMRCCWPCYISPCLDHLQGGAVGLQVVGVDLALALQLQLQNVGPYLRTPTKADLPPAQGCWQHAQCRQPDKAEAAESTAASQGREELGCMLMVLLDFCARLRRLPALGSGLTCTW